MRKELAATLLVMLFITGIFLGGFTAGVRYNTRDRDEAHSAWCTSFAATLTIDTAADPKMHTVLLHCSQTRNHAELQTLLRDLADLDGVELVQLTNGAARDAVRTSRAARVLAILRGE